MKKRIKISFILFGLAIFFVVVHNAIYGLFKLEDPVSFILALISIFGLLISVIYNLTVSFLKKKK